MLKRIFIILAMLFVYTGAAVPRDLQAEEAGKPLRILCTILPIYVFTLNVVDQIPGIEVKLLLSPHQGCPHNYDLTPGDLLNLSRAEVIVANGLGMESFLEPFFRQRKKKVTYIEAAAKINPIREEPLPTRLRTQGINARDDHSLEMNGHTWVSPKAAATMVETIAEGLALQYPTQARKFLANGRRYAEKLRNLAREMKEIVSRAKNQKVLAFHDILAYLARDTGLTVAAVIEPQLGLEPSSRDMVRLIQIAKNQKVAAIFSEPPYSDKLVRVLSQESGVPWFAFDPVASGKPAAETYEKAMRKNIEILRKALR